MAAILSSMVSNSWGLRSRTLIVSLSPGEYFLSSIRKPVPSSNQLIVLPKAIAVRGYVCTS